MCIGFSNKSNTIRGLVSLTSTTAEAAIQLWVTTNSLPWLNVVEQTTQPPSQSFAVSTHTARSVLKGFIGGPHGLGKPSDSHPIICATSCFLVSQQNRAVEGTRPRAGLADVVDYRLMFFIPIPQ